MDKKLIAGIIIIAILVGGILVYTFGGDIPVSREGNVSITDAAGRTVQVISRIGRDEIVHAVTQVTVDEYVLVEIIGVDHLASEPAIVRRRIIIDLNVVSDDLVPVDPEELRLIGIGFAAYVISGYEAEIVAPVEAVYGYLIDGESAIRR